jgi:peptide subunit release factor 1 (eRF1)
MTAAVHPDLGRVLVVVLDRGHARFFDVSASEAAELPCLRSPAMRGGKFHSDRQGGPGWGEHDYHGRIREEARRHINAVVQRLERLDRERPADGLLVAGPGPAAGAVARSLPPVLAARLIGTAHLKPAEVTPATVARAARQARAGHEAVSQRELVARMEDGLGTGRATNGARETLRALAKGQVRTLLVRTDVRAAGFRCRSSGRLVLSAADCLGDGTPVPVPDVVEEASVAARRQGATIAVIQDPDAARRIDGFAALLRFA